MPLSRIKTAGTTLAALLLLWAATAAGSETVTIDQQTLSLSQCLDLARRTNPAGHLARQNLRAVRERPGEGRGGYYPTLKLSSSYTYTTPQEGMAPSSADSYDTRLTVRQPLFDGGATSRLLEGIKHSVNAQEHEVGKSDLDIAYTVRATFLDILKKQALLEVRKTALAGTEQQLAQAVALHREGVSPRADVLKSEVQVSSARLEMVRADHAVLAAKAALAAAIGVPVTSRFAVEGGAENNYRDDRTPPVEDIMAEARALRPEIKGLTARLEAAEAAIRQAESGLYPNVSLDASYGWQESGFVPTDRKWGVGVTIGLPVFERFTTSSKVAQAQAGRDGLKAAQMQVMRMIELEVEQTWLLLKEAQERLVTSRKRLEQAEEDLRVSEGRYKEGLGTLLELIDARTALIASRTEVVTSTYDIADAQAKLGRATGKGL